MTRSGGVGEPPNEQLMHLTRLTASGCTVLSVTGEIEAMTVPRLVTALEAALHEEPPAPVVLDLSRVRFLASSGLSALQEVTVESERRGDPLRIVVDTARPVVRPIQIAGLQRRLALFHSVEDAAAFQA